MLAVLAWLGTHVFWALNTTEILPPAMVAETDPQQAAQAIASRHLFGEAVSGETVAVTALDIRLTGVIAAQEPGKTAMAFLAFEGKPAVAVREGDEVAPGITLGRVQARQVELLRGGRTQILALPQPKSSPQPNQPLLQSSQASPAPNLALPQPSQALPQPAQQSPRRRGRVARSYEDDS